MDYEASYWNCDYSLGLFIYIYCGFFLTATYLEAYRIFCMWSMLYKWVLKFFLCVRRSFTKQSFGWQFLKALVSTRICHVIFPRPLFSTMMLFEMSHIPSWPACSYHCFNKNNPSVGWLDTHCKILDLSSNCTSTVYLTHSTIKYIGLVVAQIYFLYG